MYGCTSDTVGYCKSKFTVKLFASCDYVTMLVNLSPSCWTLSIEIVLFMVTHKVIEHTCLWTSFTFNGKLAL